MRGILADLRQAAAATLPASRRQAAVDGVIDLLDPSTGTDAADLRSHNPRLHLDVLRVVAHVLRSTTLPPSSTPRMLSLLARLTIGALEEEGGEEFDFPEQAATLLAEAALSLQAHDQADDADLDHAEVRSLIDATWASAKILAISPESLSQEVMCSLVAANASIRLLGDRNLAQSMFRDLCKRLEAKHARGELSDVTLLLRAHLFAGDAARDLERFDEAESAFTRAIELTSAQHLLPSNYLARLHKELGLTFYRQLRLDESVARYEEALRILQTWPREPEAEEDAQVAEIHNGLAAALHLLERRDEARQHLERAVDLAERRYEAGLPASDNTLANMSSNLGMILYGLNAFTEAVTHLERALPIQLSAEMNPQAALLTRSNLGLALTALGRTGEAVAQFEEAIRSWEALATDEDPPEWVLHHAGALNNLGFLLGLQEQYEAAEPFLREAARRLEHLNMQTGGRYTDQATAACVNVGYICDQHDKLQEARAAYEQAIRLDPTGGFPSGRMARLALGRLLCSRLNNPAEALEHLRRALTDVEYHRKRHLPRETDRSFFDEAYVGGYEDAVACCLDLGLTAEAWQYVVRSKARNLFERLEGVTPRLTAGQREVYDRWRTTLRLIDTPQVLDPSSSEEVQQQLRVEERRLREQVLHMTEPDFVTSAVPDVLVLVEALKKLASNQRVLFVEFARLPEDRYAVFTLPLWEVEQASPSTLSLRANVIPTTSEQIAECRLAFEEALRRARENGEVDADAFRDAAMRIGTTFLIPWIESIGCDLSDLDALIVVPAGVLYGMPLHMGYLNDGRALIEAVPVVYFGGTAVAPTLARRLDSPRRSTGRVAMGPPDADALPDSLSEAQHLRVRYGFSHYAGAAMNVEQLTNRGGSIDVLHLATHARFDNDDFWQSFITFHQERLTLSRLIADPDFDFSGMRLCYLNSCESGQSHASHADDLHGFVWALQYAGAEAVMAGMWETQDAAAAIVAHRFYLSALSSPFTTMARALQEAVCYLKRQHDFSSPFYWAPFVLYGNGLADLGSLRTDDAQA